MCLTRREIPEEMTNDEVATLAGFENVGNLNSLVNYVSETCLGNSSSSSSNARCATDNNTLNTLEGTYNELVHLNGLVFGNGNYLAVGDNGTIGLSSNL